MMTEVEATVDPDTLFADGDVVLRVDGPLAGFGNGF